MLLFRLRLHFRIISSHRRFIIVIVIMIIIMIIIIIIIMIVIIIIIIIIMIVIMVMTVTRKICECAPLADWEQGTITAQRLVMSRHCHRRNVTSQL